jgi:hypothetical protein
VNHPVAVDRWEPFALHVFEVREGRILGICYFLDTSPTSACRPRSPHVSRVRADASRLPAGARYRRIAKRRGTRKAIVATGNTVLTIAWYLLSDPNGHCRELGGDYYQRHVDTERRARALARQLQELTGQKITIRSGRAVLADAA